MQIVRVVIIERGRGRVGFDAVVIDGTKDDAAVANTLSFIIVDSVGPTPEWNRRR